MVYANPALPMGHHQPQYLAGSFDGLPRPGYDTAPNLMYRAGEMPQGAVNHHAAYGYPDGRGLAGVSEVMDSEPNSHE